VVRSILGVSIVTDDLDAARGGWQALGFDFGPAWDDEGDTVRQADTGRGTFLQLRIPTSPSAPSRDWLEHYGPGLYHLVLAVPDLDGARARLDSAGVRFDRVAEGPGLAGAAVTRSLWTRPDTTCGVPMELRA
jgi:hypothetical protein